MLSVIGDYVKTVKSALQLNITKIKIANQDYIEMNNNYAIFSTFRCKFDAENFVKMPLNIVQYFRVVSMIRPNLALLLTHMLGHMGTHRAIVSWSNKLLYFIKMWDVTRDNIFFIKEQKKSLRFLAHSDQKARLRFDLKLIVKLLSNATNRFYKKIKYWYMVQQYQLDNSISKSTAKVQDTPIGFDMLNFFTRLFQKEVLIYVGTFTKSQKQVDITNRLFSDIFRFELNAPHPQNLKKKL